MQSCLQLFVCISNYLIALTVHCLALFATARMNCAYAYVDDRTKNLNNKYVTYK